MTPMIDLTFLLIIFFIIVNDMTQQELEDLKLPIAQTAGHDDPPKGRPILNVMDNGTIIWKGEKLYYPGIVPRGQDPIRTTRPDYYWYLAETMIVEWIPYMKTDFDENLQKTLPDDPILIRADRNTPFRYIQKIMEVCTREGIYIWKVQLAASEPEATSGAK
jgi:biopolymer transport protein ExbD